MNKHRTILRKRRESRPTLRSMYAEVGAALSAASNTKRRAAAGNSTLASGPNNN